MLGKLVGCVVVCVLFGQAASAQSCLRPIPPFVPADPANIREYSDLLRRDMEAYFADVEQYFRCQDAQRAEVFEEVGLASEAYGRVLEARDNR